MTDISMIECTVQTLFPAGTVTEVRILGAPRQGTISGYFNDPALLAAEAATWSGKAPGVYITLNPCKPDLLARAANRLQTQAKTTTADHDIVRRYWLPLDFDPVRPAGISSTDVEHETALHRAQACTEWLMQTYAWPEPVRADSGNGGHLLYAIHLPNDEASRDLLKRCLEALDVLFSDDTVALDTSVFNAARIWKLYGTMACKGDSLPERPHRLSTLLTTPPHIHVTLEQLTALAALAPEPVQPSTRRGSSTAMDIPAWITQHDLQVAKEGPWKGDGYRWILSPCPWNADHTDNSAHIVQFASGAVAAGCKHNGCQGKNWHALRDLCEPGGDGDAGNSFVFLRRDGKSGDPHKTSLKGNSFVSSFSSLDTHAPQWPVLQPEALYGLAGDYVRAIEPHSESDPVALLAQFMVQFGVVIGRHSYGQVEASKHYGNLFCGIVGKTARSRKGTSHDHIDAQMRRADTTWTQERHVKGVGSGEGLIFAVRDRRMGREPIKEKGRIVDYQDVVVDEGVRDKRALYQTGELASLLKVAGREGNTLSETLRDIWDTGYLCNTVKHQPLRATDAHIGVIGHITVDELRRLITSTDMGNGFCNRFIWVCAQRSKELPDGGHIASVNFAPLTARLCAAFVFSRQARKVVRDPDAAAVWRLVYGKLSENRTGLADSILARAEAQVFRLSILYALLDCSECVQLPHLYAALALWQYAEDSAAYIFGSAVGDETADPILGALMQVGDAGLTREQLMSDVFKGNIRGAEVTRALILLEEHGRIRRSTRVAPSGKGRPATVYHTIGQHAYEGNEVNSRRYLIASNGAAKPVSFTYEEIAKNYEEIGQNDEKKASEPCVRADRSTDAACLACGEIQQVGAEGGCKGHNTSAEAEPPKAKELPQDMTEMTL